MSPSSIPQAFLSRAHELTAWTRSRLVNRTDVWGGYCRLDGRSESFPGPYTKPALALRGRRSLGYGTIYWNYAAGAYDSNIAPERIVGLHAVSQSNTSLWGAIEVDQHGPKNPAVAAVNLAAAMSWYARLVSLGFRPLLTDSNGAGGYHLRTIFAEAIPSPIAFSFMAWLASDHERYGMASQPETFPKQRRVEPSKPFGNWLRLPGRHHTREHWSTVWDGSRWLAGHDAIDFILSLQGDPAELIPAEVTKSAAEEDEHERERRQCQPVYAPPPNVRCDPDSIVSRARAYIAKKPIAVSGNRGHDALFNVACALVIGFALPRPDAEILLREYSERCEPRWSEAEIQHKLNDAEKVPGPRGEKLAADRPRKLSKRELDLLAEIAVLGDGPLEIEWPDRRITVEPSTTRPTPTPPPLGQSLAGIETKFLDKLLDDAHAERATADAQAATQGPSRRSAANQMLCPNMASVVQAFVDKSGGRIGFYPCDRIDCHVCRKTFVERWEINFKLRLMDGTVPDEMFVFYVPKEQWEKAKSYIRRRVDSKGNKGRYMMTAESGHFFSTICPPSVPRNRGKGKEPGFAAVATPITRQEALEQLTETVRNVSPIWNKEENGNPIHHSVGWGLKKEENDGPKIFVNVGKGPGGADAVERTRAIIDEHGVTDQKMTGRKSIWSKFVCSIVFKFPAFWGARRKDSLLRSLIQDDEFLGHFVEPEIDLFGDWGDETDGEEIQPVSQGGFSVYDLSGFHTNSVLN